MTANSGRPSKVARLVAEYDLEGLGAELEARWTAEDPDERWSLRDLAAYFNRQLLREAMVEAGVQTVDGEVDNVYRLLTDDDVRPADRTRARRRLEREGVDVEALESDFVSYQAIRTYLKSHRDAEYAPDRDRVASATTTVQQLRNRTTAVVESKLDQLRDEELTLGDVRVITDVRVVCQDCGAQYDAVDLFDRGGCDCEEL